MVLERITRMGPGKHPHNKGWLTRPQKNTLQLEFRLVVVFVKVSCYYFGEIRYFEYFEWFM